MLELKVLAEKAITSNANIIYLLLLTLDISKGCDIVRLKKPTH